MNFTPLLDRVLVRQDPNETKTSSGFFIPEVAAEKAYCGTIVATGAGRQLKDGTVIPTEVAAGQRVMYEPNVGIKVKVEGEDLLVIKEENIIAIVD